MRFPGRATWPPIQGAFAILFIEQAISIFHNVHIGLTQQIGKLVFVGLCPDCMSLRTSAHAGVAIPQLEGKCIDNNPAEWENVAFFGGNRYLVPFIGGIATPVCGLVRNDSV